MYYITLHYIRLFNLGKKFPVCTGNYWASEASPTLGCSIKISHDIYIYISVCMSTTCQNQNMCMLKVSFGLKPTDDTRVIHFDYMLEQL